MNYETMKARCEEIEALRKRIENAKSVIVNADGTREADCEHEWSEWIVGSVDGGMLFVGVQDSRKKNNIQQRECLKCGKTELGSVDDLNP